MESKENNGEVKRCLSDCLQCSVQQRIFCAAQMSRTLIDRVEQVGQQLDTIAQRLERIERMNEYGTEGLINPTAKAEAMQSDESEAQEASGAENRLPRE